MTQRCLAVSPNVRLWPPPPRMFLRNDMILLMLARCMMQRYDSKGDRWRQREVSEEGRVPRGSEKGSWQGWTKANTTNHSTILTACQMISVWYFDSIRRDAGWVGGIQLQAGSTPLRADKQKTAERLSSPGGEVVRTIEFARTRSATRTASRAGWSANRCTHRTNLKRYPS
jgi:hypothetical protein